MDQPKTHTPLAVFPHADGSRVPYKISSDDEIYVLDAILEIPGLSCLG
jgi:hypothetical protein